MKTGALATFLALCLPVTVFATTLRLSNEIDLLVLDGKKVSSSLLRGAESIELENGPHQLVFRVEKTIRLPGNEERLYISPPLVISFDTQLISQVNFSSRGWKTSAKPRILTRRRVWRFWTATPCPFR